MTILTVRRASEYWSNPWQSLASFKVVATVAASYTTHSYKTAFTFRRPTIYYTVSSDQRSRAGNRLRWTAAVVAWTGIRRLPVFVLACSVHVWECVCVCLEDLFSTDGHWLYFGAHRKHTMPWSDIWWRTNEPKTNLLPVIDIQFVHIGRLRSPISRWPPSVWIQVKCSVQVWPSGTSSDLSKIASIGLSSRPILNEWSEIWLSNRKSFLLFGGHWAVAIAHTQDLLISLTPSDVGHKHKLFNRLELSSSTVVNFPWNYLLSLLKHITIEFRILFFKTCFDLFRFCLVPF